MDFLVIWLAADWKIEIKNIASDFMVFNIHYSFLFSHPHTLAALTAKEASSKSNQSFCSLCRGTRAYAKRLRCSFDKICIEKWGRNKYEPEALNHKIIELYQSN